MRIKKITQNTRDFNITDAVTDGGTDLNKDTFNVMQDNVEEETQKIGDLTKLNTDKKTNLVDAINEIDTNINNLQYLIKLASGVVYDTSNGVTITTPTNSLCLVAVTNWIALAGKEGLWLVSNITGTYSNKVTLYKADAIPDIIINGQNVTIKPKDGNGTAYAVYILCGF